MEGVNSGLVMAGEIFSGFWSFATTNTLVLISLVVSLVGVGIGLFLWLKSRLGAKRK